MYNMLFNKSARPQQVEVMECGIKQIWTKPIEKQQQRIVHPV